ncbi:unnamed protein product [Pleuronectes platessa]|uniref:Uncharacterized protein n=1 Tax=Pleuronectes platessa TaxID=8262 RepID=A0A9N7V7C3_PLEPL|nr:unnamed protein product [Pleuronectes platessa]
MSKAQALGCDHYRRLMLRGSCQPRTGGAVDVLAEGWRATAKGEMWKESNNTSELNTAHVSSAYSPGELLVGMDWQDASVENRTGGVWHGFESLESRIQFTFMFLDCGTKLEKLQKLHAGVGANSPDGGSSQLHGPKLRGTSSLLVAEQWKVSKLH